MKGFKKALVLLTVVLVICAAAACGSSKEKGTYVCEMIESGMSIKVEMTLDGKGNGTQNTSMTYEGETETSTDEFTYVIDGEKITLTQGDNSIEGTISGDTLTLKGQEYKKK